jgi:hypothetical protein
MEGTVTTDGIPVVSLTADVEFQFDGNTLAVEICTSEP